MTLPIKPIIRSPRLADKTAFIAAACNSVALHSPWVQPPISPEAFDEYLSRSQQPNQLNFIVEYNGVIAGVINISEIIFGNFQSAYLGFYAMAGFERRGVMGDALRQVLHYAFETLCLHRLEANIQPSNLPSIGFVRKNGFRHAGFSPRYLFIDGEWRDHEHWEITKEEYLLHKCE